MATEVIHPIICATGSLYQQPRPTLEPRRYSGELVAHGKARRLAALMHAHTLLVMIRFLHVSHYVSAQTRSDLTLCSSSATGSGLRGSERMQGKDRQCLTTQQVSGRRGDNNHCRSLNPSLRSPAAGRQHCPLPLPTPYFGNQSYAVARMCRKSTRSFTACRATTCNATRLSGLGAGHTRHQEEGLWRDPG